MVKHALFAMVCVVTALSQVNPPNCPGGLNIGNLCTVSGLATTGTGGTVVLATTPTFITSALSPIWGATGALTIKPGTDSTASVQIQTTTGSPVVRVDTQFSRFGIAGSLAPAFSLDVFSSAVALESGNFLRSTSSTAGSFGVVAFDLESSGTPAATFGPGNVFYANSSTTARQPQGGIETGWTVATHASRAAFMKFNTVATGGVYIEQLRITDTGLLTFQGITSSFPALKRSSAKLQIRLADDSAAGTIEGKYNSSDGTAGFTGTCTVLSITAITVKDGLITGCS